MLKEDEGIFYRKTKEKNKRNGKTPNFWAEIWKDNAKTSQRKLMNINADNLSVNIDKIEVLIINEKKVYETVKKSKSW